MTFLSSQKMLDVDGTQIALTRQQVLLQPVRCTCLPWRAFSAPHALPNKSSRLHTRLMASISRQKDLIAMPEDAETDTNSHPRRIQSYFDRIRLSERDRASIAGGKLSLEVLRSICVAHAEAIPFENLDLVYEPAKAAAPEVISIQFEDVFDKLVTRRRGGYCFENNGLLSHMLRAIGFELWTVAARVVLDKRPDNPDEIVMSGLDHQVLLVRVDGQLWVCDVGFGGSTPKFPVRLAEESAEGNNIPAGPNRVRRGLLANKLRPQDVKDSPQREGWYMQRFSTGRKTWHDLYFFTEQEWRDSDYEVPNFYCSYRHPLFCKQVVVALQTESGRKTISGSKLRLVDSNGAKESDVSEPSNFEQALKDHFGLHIPVQ